jgi:mannose-6-phosphate isomerase
MSPEKVSLINRLALEFPNDIGLVVCCLLNYRSLPINSCFGIDAGVPHAYIKGECFELMNNSDNVVRLGLTPK